jgi:heat shock protein HslJ
MKPFFIFFCFIFSISLQSQSLQGTSWALQSINDRENNMKQDINPAFKIFILFSTDSTYNGRACNDFNGNYRQQPSQRISFSRPSATKKFCQGPLGNIEKNLFSLLSRADKFVLSDNRLVIYTNDQHEMVFVR